MFVQFLSLPWWQIFLTMMFGVSPFSIWGCCKMGPERLHLGKRPLCWWRRQIMAIELQWSDTFTTIFKIGHGHSREVAHHLWGLKLTCVFDRFCVTIDTQTWINLLYRLLDMFASLCVIQPFPVVIGTIFLHPRMGRASHRETSAYKGPQLTWWRSFISE